MCCRRRRFIIIIFLICPFYQFKWWFKTTVQEYSKRFFFVWFYFFRKILRKIEQSTPIKRFSLSKKFTSKKEKKKFFISAVFKSHEKSQQMHVHLSKKQWIIISTVERKKNSRNDFIIQHKHCRCETKQAKKKTFYEFSLKIFFFFCSPECNLKWTRKKTLVSCWEFIHFVWRCFFLFGSVADSKYQVEFSPILQ